MQYNAMKKRVLRTFRAICVLVRNLHVDDSSCRQKEVLPSFREVSLTDKKC